MDALTIFFIILTACIVALLGLNRKIGYGWSLFFCLFLSPLIGLTIILCSPKLPQKRKKVQFIEATESYPVTESEQTQVTTSESIVSSKKSSGWAAFFSIFFFLCGMLSFAIAITNIIENMVIFHDSGVRIVTSIGLVGFSLYLAE